MRGKGSCNWQRRVDEYADALRHGAEWPALRKEFGDLFAHVASCDECLNAWRAAIIDVREEQVQEARSQITSRSGDMLRAAITEARERVRARAGESRSYVLPLRAVAGPVQPDTSSLPATWESSAPGQSRLPRLR